MLKIYNFIKWVNSSIFNAYLDKNQILRVGRRIGFSNIIMTDVIR